MVNNEEQTTLACANCGEEAPTSQQFGGYIDYGWSMSNYDLGHYGGFSDNFPPDVSDVAHICHDCCVLMLSTMPGLAKTLLPNGGGHPNKNGEGIGVPSCCAWAWTWDENEKCSCEYSNNIVYLGSPDGRWRRQECPNCVAKRN